MKTLVYHGFEPGLDSPQHRLHRSTTQFADDLVDHGHAFRFSLDDGTDRQYAHAWPVLRQLNIQALWFIIAGFVGRPGYMDWDQLRQLHQDGQRIECHTMHHPRLTTLMRSEMLEEFTSSADLIQQKIGRRPELFAPPYEAVNSEVIRAGRDSGLIWIGPRITIYNDTDLCQI